MKKRILLVLFFCIRLCDAQVTFHKSFGGFANINSSAIQLFDHGFAILGNDTGDYTCLIKIDSLGNHLWSKQYLTGRPVSELIQTSDGGFAFIAFLNFASIIIRTDILGNVLWSESIDNPGGLTELNSIIQTNDGGFIIAGRDKHASTDSDIYLLKIDPAGNELWSKEYSGNVFSEGGIYAEQTSDSGYIIYGVWNTNASVLLKADSIGNLQWSYKYAGAYLNSNFKVHQTFDNGYVFSALYYALPTIIKVNDTGIFQWGKSYQCSNLASCQGFAFTSEGGFILSGTSNSRLFLVKTNSDGDTLWTRSIGDSILENGNSIYQTSDGGYVIAGYRDSSSAELTVFKTDANGSISCGSESTSTSINDLTITPTPVIYDSLQASTTIAAITIMASNRNVMNTICTSIGIEETTLETSISVFPNPTTGKFSVYHFNKVNSREEIEVFNLTGERLEYQTEGDISNFSPGMYIVKVTLGEKVWRTKIIKE